MKGKRAKKLRKFDEVGSKLSKCKNYIEIFYIEKCA